MGFVDSAALFLVDRVFDHLGRGDAARVSEWLLGQLRKEGRERFQSALQQTVAKHGWEESRPILAHLRSGPLNDWIPAWLAPTLTFLDIERHPDTGLIHEVAFLRWDTLDDSRELLSAVSGRKDCSVDRVEVEEHVARCGGDVLVGHNLADFDLPRLREFGVRIPEEQVAIDTLRLSLLAYPLRASHALEGAHRAAEDVEDTLTFFQELDAYWLRYPASEACWLHWWLKEEPGLGGYFEWLLRRRNLPFDQEAPSGGLASAVEPWYGIVSDAALELPEGRGGWMDGLQRLEGSDPHVLHGSEHPLTVDDLPEVIHWARSRSARVALPSPLLARHRQLCNRRPGADLGDWGVGLASDRVVAREVFERPPATLPPGKGAAALYCWLRAGGIRSTQLHGLLRQWIEDEHLLDSCSWRPVGSFPPGKVVDLESWLNGTDVSVVLGVEQAEEAASAAGTVKASIPEPSTQLTRQVGDVIESRELFLGPQRFGSRSAMLSVEDLSDPVVSDVLDSLAHADVAMGPVPDRTFDWRRAIEGDKFAVFVEARAVREVIEEVSLTANPLDAVDTLRSRLAEGAGVAGFAGRCSRPIADWVADRLGRPTADSVPTPSSLPVSVVAGSGMGTASGLGRSMVAALRAMVADGTGNASIIEVPTEVREPLAQAFRASGLPLYADHRFGTRDRTLQRLDDGSDFGLLAGHALTPLPSATKSVFLRRLPFPSPRRPDILAAVQRLPADADPFREVVLPRMLLSLSSMVAMADSAGFELQLLDGRATRHVAYRRSLELNIGRLREIAPRLSGDQQSLIGTSQKSIHNALRDAGFAGTTMDFSAVDPTPVLRRLLGRDASWRGSQQTIVQTILAGKSALAVLPTGTGKSLCYQIPAVVFGELADQLTIVFSPLLALMRDQVDSLRKKGVLGVAAYNASLGMDEKRDILADIRAGWTTLLYLAPEQLTNPAMRDALTERGVHCVVVDEAHCISQWGHDFRPDYRRIPDFLEEMEGAHGKRPVVAAFTATATPEIGREVSELLGIGGDPVMASVRRPEITPAIEPLNSEAGFEERMQRIRDFLQGRPNTPGIIYCLRRRDAERIAEWLRAADLAGFPAAGIEAYHAQSEDRAGIESRFIDPDEPTQVICATTAFGMGVDKPDVGWVVHFNAPGSVEAYLQEIGRAARGTNQSAETLALISAEDLDHRRNMAAPISEELVSAVLSSLRTQSSADGRVIASPQHLAEALNDKPERVNAAIFLLDECGNLCVTGRATEWLHVRRVQPPERSVDKIETAIVNRISESELPSDISVPDLVKESASDHDCTFEETEQIVRSLVAEDVLVTDDSLLVTPASDLEEPQEREAALWDAMKARQRFACTLDGFLDTATGRWRTLSLEELGSALRAAGLPVSCLEAELAVFRSLGLLSVHRKTMGLSIRRRGEGSLENGTAALVRRMGRELESLAVSWAETEGEPARLVPGSRKQEQALRQLGHVGLIRLEDQRRPRQSLMVELSPSPESDARRIAELNLRGRKRAAQIRHRWLETLASEPRHGEAVWDILVRYFNGEALEHARPDRANRIRKGLNAQQRAAVEAPGDRPILINAAAGTGKTDVLARRILRLQSEEGIDADGMLVLSFSRSGAAGIGDRIASLASELGLHRVRVRTFHALCRQLLLLLEPARELVGRIKLPRELKHFERKRPHWANERSFNALLVQAYERILRPVVGQNVAPPDGIMNYGAVLDALRSGHPQLDDVYLTPQHFEQALHSGSVPESLEVPDSEETLKSQNVAAVWHGYDRAMRDGGQIDFPEMVARCLLTLRDNKAFRASVTQGIDHILVDEFQDTSRAQEELMRRLVGDTGGITVVGDNDQTIFSFNGSDVRNILEFESRNASLRGGSDTIVLPLEENFRSTGNILTLASRVIERNEQRISKSIRPAKALADTVREQYRSRNSKVSLVETVGPENSVESCVPYIEHWIHNDGLDPTEIAVLARMNPPGSREKAVLDQLGKALRAAGIPISHSADEAKSHRELESWVTRVARQYPDRLVRDLVAALDDDRCPSQLSGLDNEFLVRASRAVLNRGIETVGDWAKDITENTAGLQDAEGGGSGGVTLKTIHRAKGEEYRRVLLLHLGWRFFPKLPKAPSDERLRAAEEEERRLLYVGITRAEEELVVFGEAGSTFFEELVQAGEGVLTREAAPAEQAAQTESSGTVDSDAPGESTYDASGFAATEGEDNVRSSPPSEEASPSKLDEGFDAMFNNELD